MMTTKKFIGEFFVALISAGLLIAIVSAAGRVL